MKEQKLAVLKKPSKKLVMAFCVGDEKPKLTDSRRIGSKIPAQKGE